MNSDIVRRPGARAAELRGALGKRSVAHAIQGPRRGQPDALWARRPTPPLWGFGIALGALATVAVGCSRPAPCVEAGTIARALSFDEAKHADALVAWQTRARAGMREALGLDALEAQAPPVVVRAPQPGPMVGTAIVIHGHGFSALNILRVTELGDRLSSLGWRVIAPGPRGFGGYPKDGPLRHRAYVESLPDNAYLPAVLSDLMAAVRRETAGRPGPVVVVGHSLGAYLALHLAALEPRIDAVMLVGLYLRTACVNSDEHASCQHHARLAARLGSEDLAMLVAPRPLAVVWGTEDRFYTDAARGLIALTARRFAAVGAESRFTTKILPGSGHNWIDPETVVSFVEQVRKNASSAKPGFE